jgi:sugar/nucleoside kinase (ribokinase family)
LIGKIGNDLFGRALQDIITAEGPPLADDLVIDLTLPTSFTIIINPPGFDRTFIHHPGANDTLYASDLPRGILQGADLFHFGYPPLMRSIYRGEGAELVSILQRARRAGLTTSLDYTLPDPSSPAGRVDWPAILDNTLPLVDLFVPSIEELLFLLNRETL